MADWITLGIKWAQQLVRRSPNTFPNGWNEFQQRIDNAAQNANRSEEEYIKSFLGLDLPMSANQTMAFMIFTLSMLHPILKIMLIKRLFNGRVHKPK